MVVTYITLYTVHIKVYIYMRTALVFRSFRDKIACFVDLRYTKKKYNPIKQVT